MRWLTGGAALVVALALLVPSRALAQATPQGCGYGTGGPNASTLCWIDMTGYSDTDARSAVGQPMTVRLPGGYSISFTIKSRGRGVTSTAFPNNGRASYIGNLAYVNTPGKPALYTSSGSRNTTTTLTLENIEVGDAAGQPVTGYALVGADAENTGSGERITWTSDQPIYEIARLSPPDIENPNGCQHNVERTNPTTITCTGNNTPDTPYGTVIVAANAPTRFSQALYTSASGHREAVAFAIMTSKIQLTKSVVGRVRGSDSFDVSARSPEGSTIGSASTGSGSSATTGELTVLPRTDGASYTLGEAVTAGSGTRLADYSQSWSCTNDGVAEPGLPSGGGTSKTLSPAPGDDIECTVTNTQLAADLSLVKTAVGSPVVPGTEQTFSLTVTNDGPSQATSVVVTDELPDELAFVSASPGCGEAGGTVTCTIGSLAAGASETFTISGRVASSLDRCLQNTATVSSSTPDSNAGDNHSTICAPIRGRSDLSIAKTASTAAVPVGGGQVMYTLVVRNDGPSDDPGVEVTDPLAAGLTLVSAEPSQGSCSTAGTAVRCDLGTLRAGGSAQVQVTATASATPRCITNIARVRGAHEDPATDDNEASSRVCVPAPPAAQPPAPPPSTPSTFDLAVRKRASDRTVVVGQRVSYRIMVTNNGPQAAPDVRLTDTLNAPESVVSVRTTAGSCSRRIPMRCELGAISPGARVTITVVVKHRESGCRQRNAAGATGNGTDTAPGTNLDTVDVCVRRVRLQLTKVASRSTVIAGGTVGYRIRVRNPSRGEARRVRVCDRLPSGMRFIGSTPKGKHRGGRRCWTINRLGARKSRTYRVTVRVAPGASGRKVNRATATSADVRGVRARSPVRIRGARGGVTG